MIEQIDHIGIAVRSIDEARKFYEQGLGLVCEKLEEVPSQKVRTAFFTVGELHIELLEPTDPKSPIAGFLEKRGEGIHHIAYKTDNIEENMEKIRSCGGKMINETPITGAGGKQVAFIHPKSSHGVLSELCSPAPDNSTNS